jgi:hypothetical protein
MQRILIYSEYDSNRLRYVLDILFVKLQGISWELTDHLPDFLESGLPKINYSTKKVDHAPQVIPTQLLFETGIRPQVILAGKWENIPVIFVTNKTASIPFDIFAATFFMLSRYEEYLPFEPDIHGRFRSELSIAYRYGFLEEPIIQQWCNCLIQKLWKQYGPMELHKPTFQFEPTIDIDVAYAFLYRGLKRSLGGTLRDLLYFRWNSFQRRLFVMLSLKTDPFDTYDYITQIHQKLEHSPSMFYLAGNYDSHDKNILLSHPAASMLLEHLFQHHPIGIHPSYYAFDHREELELEVLKLSQILKAPIHFSRQHYLRLKFPETYRDLILLGITNDFSMGFHDRPGFRAGIAFPFPFYDLEREEQTSLIIHPFAIMERVLKDRLKLDPDMALMKIRDLMKKVIAVNGTFGTLWHNDSLSDFGEWKGWRLVYEMMLSIAIGNMTFYSKEKEE